MSDDNKKWADWFNSLAWAAVWSRPEDRQELKAQADHMARQRLVGVSFEEAETSYGKPFIPIQTTEQMVAGLSG